ncbi:uncharacterized protein MONBRDRAFT_26614 [Monosiga brevicollis MX1]|uniref:Multifunctional fusion protein n=1 Tax=Monosiga brevicollis TaxID=81824 RepID=A9V2V7_MONBE|nr:uncharacterized protein MONBRDRAFT_26614 [Monosiga brevicollis MX1]EDQ87953.1 predicted protein [Monosiga brevicollis MX1]|eukprot:XP_001747029.1 hypothetical protein [Monosiga brevicollis MX1]
MAHAAHHIARAYPPHGRLASFCAGGESVGEAACEGDEYRDFAFTPLLPTRLYTAAQVRDNEARAAKEMNISMPDLMHRAGSAAYELLTFARREARHITLLIGKGNNGGDAYIVGQRALENGLTVHAAQVGDPEKLKGDALNAYKRFVELGGVVQPLDEHFVIPSETQAIVDGLFGIGLDRDIAPGPFRRAIEQANAHPSALRLAIDIPSGILADTGKVAGVAFQADVTVTFIACKKGLLTAKAPDYVGRLYYAPLDVRQAFENLVTCTIERVSYQSLLRDDRLLALRPMTAHKGSFGKAILVGGYKGMPGAIRMAGEACQRVGAGLVRVVTHTQSLAPVAIGRPELMVEGLDEEVLAQSDRPVVLDADALNLLADRVVSEPSRTNWVLTPHPGEAARLLGVSTSEVEQDRFAAARQLQIRYGGVILLKGSGTIVDDGSLVSVVSDGNPGMGSGGMGDTLTGIITGLLAQGLSPSEAARVGAALHARAADEVASTYGERGMLATDLLEPLRHLVNPVRRVRLQTDA